MIRAITLFACHCSSKRLSRISPLVVTICSGSCMVVDQCREDEDGRILRVKEFPIEDHEEFQEHQAITIAHVHGCHYIKVQLEGEYPMPTMMALLKDYKHSSAAEWESFYKERIKMYTQFLPRSSADVIDV
ncbi:hypothetical protein R6Q59_023865 [Mikania micrantha]